MAQIAMLLAPRRRDQAVVCIGESGRGVHLLIADGEDGGDQLKRAAGRVLAEVSLGRHDRRRIAEKRLNRLRFEAVGARGPVRRRINSIDIM